MGENWSKYGDDQLVAPPDAQIAASPSQLVEIAGATMAILGRDGSLQWSIDLHTMFQLAPTSDFGAPSLQYDYSSSRWFLGASATDFQTGAARLYLAVSRTSNPFGPWSVNLTYSLDDTPANLNFDYFLSESLAVTTDKVVQATQTFNCESSCGSAAGARFVVLRKDQLLAATRPAADYFSFVYPFEANFMAVQMQSNFFVAYLVFLASPTVTSVPDRLGLLQVTGLPSPDGINGGGNTTVWEKDFYMSAPMPPLNVYPSQPGGTLLASRLPITSAVYRAGAAYGQGEVVLAINDICGANTCLRLMKVSNFGGATIVAQDGHPGQYIVSIMEEAPDLERMVGQAGTDLFDGSLAIDPYGNLFISAAFSSSTRNPGIALTGIHTPITSTASAMPVSTMFEGPSNYVGCTTSDTPWAGYMRSVPDPNNWTRVLTPGAVSIGSCNWATVITSATTGVGPHGAVVTPAYGSIKGGQLVEIDGAYFVPGADQVLFGTTPGAILFEAPWVIFVSTPAGAAGLSPVTVKTPDGSVAAGNFLYVDYGARTGPPTISPAPPSHR